MNLAAPPGLLHAPLQDWARTRADAVAIRCGATTLRFGELQQALQARAAALNQARAPATVLVDGGLPLPQRLVDFLGIVASGRCAAVGDADWPPAVQQAVLQALPHTACDMPAPQPESPFYVGFTSGSSGMPKGFRRHHRSWVESFRICLETFGPDAAGPILAPGRDAHSLFLFGMLLGLWSGAGVTVQERFSARATLQTLAQGDTPCLVAVPSQLLVLLDVARQRALAPMPGLRLILISGARWMRSRTAELRQLFPQARIVEFYGASETSFIAWMDSDTEAPASVVGRPFANVDVQIRRAQGADAAGLIYVRSPMLFMDYVGAADGTAALRDGDWLSVQDQGYLDAQGRLCLVGRHNRMIVTQGKNLFAEELEAVLEAHPAIAQASVQGLDDARRGAQVVAVLQWRGPADGTAPRPDSAQLRAWCQQQLEAFKCPRRFYVCSDWPRTVSGKTDHPALAQALAHLQETPATPGPTPWLQRWH